MAKSTPPTSSPRSGREIPAHKPRWAFWKGLLTGAAIEIPLVAATIWVVARFGIGDPDATFMQIVRLAAVFTGLAALLTAGGIGRLAAYTTVEKGRRRAVLVAARTHAIASAGLVLIAAIPHGHIDFRDFTWLALPLGGMVAGAMCGAVIGLVCTGTATAGLADVWLKPGEALRNLLSPADLVRLGSALRTRTSTLFEGIFDPAPPPPKATDDKADRPPQASDEKKAG